MPDFISDGLEYVVLFVVCTITNDEFLWLLLAMSTASPHTLCAPYLLSSQSRDFFVSLGLMQRM